MEKDMIELNDLSHSHHNHINPNNSPIIMALLIISSLSLKIIHMISLAEMNEIVSLVVTVGQGALITTGLVVFRWSWLDRKKKKSK